MKFFKSINNYLFKTITTKKFLLIIFILTLLYHLKLGYTDNIPSNDEFGHLRYSQNYIDLLLHGNPSDPTDSLPFWWPPGAPGFFWILQNLGFESVFSMRLIMQVLGALIPLAAYFWARKFLTESQARCVAILSFLDPYMAQESGRILSDHLFILFCLLFLYPKNLSGTKYSFFKIGLICGLLTYIRTTILFFLPFLILEIWRFQGFKSALRSGVLIGCGFLLILSPYIFRNWQITGKSFLTPHFGYVLMVNNNPQHQKPGSWVIPGKGLRRGIPYTEESLKFVDTHHAQTLPFLERFEYYKQETFQWLKNNPSEFFVNGFHRILMLFHFYPPANQGWVRHLALFFFSSLILISMFGLILTWKDPRFSWCRIVYLGITSMAFFIMITMRYRLPLNPVFFVLATFFLKQSLQKAKILR